MLFFRLLRSSCLLAALAPASIRAAGAKVPPAERTALAQSAERELRGNILPFWLEHTRNPANGGFYGLIDADMRADPSAPRGALLTSRILWTFSRAYAVYRDPAYLEMAQWAYRDLRDHFRDSEEGGLYWTITADGRPLDRRKQIYGEAFGIYALAEYHRATGDAAALSEAIELYQLIERHARDRVHGGYFDALNRDWSRRSDNLLGPGPKSQNSHIHILEAYTNLLRAWPDPGLRAAQRDLIEVTLDHLIDPQSHHLILFLADDWTPLSRTVSYGHDIELSWLITEAGQVQADPALNRRIKPIALAMAKATLAEGVDSDGGVVNEGGPGGYTDTNKDWWPQAEAAVGFANAWQESGDGRFFAAARRSWDLIEAKFVDRTHGDWIGSITRGGVPRPQPKVSLWKCPYHGSRCCFELMERLR